MKIGATAIAEEVVARIFPIPRHICVSNVSWSMLPYEADLIAVTNSGYMIEVEIKVSLADLKRDAAKSKWRYPAFDNLVSRFYYAMPDDLWQKIAAKEAVPEWAGVIVISADGFATVAREATRRQARALTNVERFNLARVGSFRAWSQSIKHRQRQLKAKREFEKRKRDHEWQRFVAVQNANGKSPEVQP